MNIQTIWTSVFDKHHKMVQPSGSFTWTRPSQSAKLNNNEIICEGDLQELEISSSALHSQRYYVATSTCIYRFGDSDMNYPDAVLNLHFPRMELFKDKMHQKCGFSLTAHEVTIQFLCVTGKEATRWYNKLKNGSEVILLHLTRDINVDKLLRRGSYAKTHSGIKKDTNSLCEVKYIAKSILLDNPSTLINLVNTIRFMKHLDHPGILKLWDIYETDQFVQLVTEPFNGCDLLSSLKSRGAYTEVDVISIMRRLLETISFLHENKIIYRDLKPENIYLTKKVEDQNWVLKIVDFGLAVKMNGSQLETLRCGFPGYVAPEVLNKEGYGTKADIFSCGILMYFLLTGIPPFGLGNTEEVFQRNKQGEFDFPAEFFSSSSQDALDLIVGMTNRDQYKRCSAQECLQHSWFSQKMTNPLPLITALDNMRYDYESQAKESKSKKKGISSSRVLPKNPKPEGNPEFSPIQTGEKSLKSLKDNMLSNVLKNQMKKSISLKNPKKEEENPFLTFCVGLDEDENPPVSPKPYLEDEDLDIPEEEDRKSGTIVSKEVGKRKLPCAPGSTSISKSALDKSEFGTKDHHSLQSESIVSSQKNLLQDEAKTSSEEFKYDYKCSSLPLPTQNIGANSPRGGLTGSGNHFFVHEKPQHPTRLLQVNENK